MTAYLARIKRARDRRLAASGWVSAYVNPETTTYTNPQQRPIFRHNEILNPDPLPTDST